MSRSYLQVVHASQYVVDFLELPRFGLVQQLVADEAGDSLFGPQVLDVYFLHLIEWSGGVLWINGPTAAGNICFFCFGV